ncbi:MAG: hypothetical protein EAZ97_13485 [Bacteroidetes bacterium]|nr:MAG: hypothetical protein EAZ97_13485 [Bacteroidota bacterium]
MNYTALFHTHKTVVILFLFIYLVKTISLFTNDAFYEKFKKITKIPEMIISVLFLVTGIAMLVQLPEIKTLQIIKITVVSLSIPVAVIGFKRKNKILAAVALLMIISTYGLAEMAKKVTRVEVVTSNVISDDSSPNYDELKHGKAIYTANCESCHGATGDAGLAGAKNLKENKRSKEETIDIITNGKNNMASYKKVLSDKEIEAVASFVLTMKN